MGAFVAAPDMAAGHSGVLRGHATVRREAFALPRFPDGNTPEAALVARVLAGEAEAFAPLVERYHRAMLSAAAQMVGDPDAAHDCSQEAFIEAYRSLRNLRDPTNFRSWLFGILRNRCRKHMGRRSVRSVPLDDEIEVPASAADEPREGPEAARIRSLMAELPASYREVLAARYFADMEYEEIAMALRTSVNNVRVRCCRARERLRTLLETRGHGKDEGSDGP